MVFSGKALVLGPLKMLSRRRGGALDTAVVGQVLLALEKAKRGLGRQGSTLTNWAPSEQYGEWWSGGEGVQHMEVCKVFLEAFTEPFFLK